MSEQETYELFDQYLSGQLTEERARALESKLEKDAELSHQFELFKKGLELVHLSGLSKDLRRLVEKKRVIRSYKKRSLAYGMAASFALIIFVASYFVLDRAVFLKDQVTVKAGKPSSEFLEQELSYLEKISLSQPDSALLLADEIVVYADSIGDIYSRGKAYWYKGRIYDIAYEDSRLAYGLYHDALEDIEEFDDVILHMKILNNLGLIYNLYGDHETASSLFGKAIKLSNESVPKRQLSNLYFNIGYTLQRRGDSISFLKAEGFFEEALKHASKVQYHGNIASIHNEIGEMYKAIRNYDMARISYRSIIRSYEHNKEMSQYVGLAYQGIGETYFEQGELDKSMEAFEKALLYKTKRGSILFTKFSLGLVFLKKGDQSRAIALWKEGLQEPYNKTNSDQVKIYAELTKALMDMGGDEDSLVYSEVYNSTMQEVLELKKYELDNKVLFADIVKDYEEFRRKEQPFYAQKWFWSVLTSVMVVVLLGLSVNYELKSRRLVRDFQV